MKHCKNIRHRLYKEFKEIDMDFIFIFKIQMKFRDNIASMVRDH